MQQTIYHIDQFLKKMKNQKNNTPQETNDWNDFWKNLKESSNGNIKKTILS
tara:strand:+ start:217 stop:369 length:153 start_codon:yes stop_codon:yes gene_type:complete